MIRDNLRLTVLHTWLVLRSLIPWPHPRATGARPRAKGPSPWQFKAYLRQLTRQHSSPMELAMAVWVGLFIGSLPIIPFGVGTIVYVCHRFRLNKVVAAVVSNLCVAPVVPLICIETGHLLLHGRLWTDFSRHGLLQEIHFRLLEWLIGSLLFGPVLGLAGGLITYGLLSRSGAATE